MQVVGGKVDFDLVRLQGEPRMHRLTATAVEDAHPRVTRLLLPVRLGIAGFGVSGTT